VRIPSQERKAHPFSFPQKAGSSRPLKADTEAHDTAQLIKKLSYGLLFMAKFVFLQTAWNKPQRRHTSPPPRGPARPCPQRKPTKQSQEPPLFACATGRAAQNKKNTPAVSQTKKRHLRTQTALHGTPNTPQS